MTVSATFSYRAPVMCLAHAAPGGRRRDKPFIIKADPPGGGPCFSSLVVINISLLFWVNSSIKQEDRMLPETRGAPETELAITPWEKKEGKPGDVVFPDEIPPPVIV